MAHRSTAQRRAFRLPALPTTTIGSFPQPEEIWRARADAPEDQRRLLDEVTRICRVLLET
ncbi:hypothetical protein ACIHFD_35765 [Nonomuraea sp. NPDC051941]|uniref:hypothetical protein n=1 Tax=Nonomuraea sp. NPDC051941 TaxID=3364373 RepID=UPI0037CB48BD